MTSSPSSPSSSSAGGWSGVLGVPGGALVVAGISGLLHEWFGFIRFLGFTRHLIPAGHEVLGYALMTFAGCLLLAGAEAVRRRDRG
ncbi:hypothetical protein ACWGHM_24700 [Streptomyces sp. NPDC054904]|uniref:hypothetical protein n=1 Tax=unclassified Streptomyces TaxID=2593676 RepID=UPI0029BA317B|nr:hypothetical protein [Streptomyces sp. DK15]MDX2392456.1 hypothetical protein [Streptomyces sp. DK15]